MEHVDDRGYSPRVLLETDRLYFSLGARRSSRSGLDLMYMPGHTASPSGAVVWGVDRSCPEDRFSQMLPAAEAELRALGGRTLRVYVEDPVPDQIARTCLQAGYRARVEVALLAPIPTILETPVAVVDHAFIEVQTSHHWELKELLHSADSHQADGYGTAAGDWVGLERVKCDTGGMSCYLVLREEQPVAAVGLLLDRGIARLKNLYVSPQARKGGIGLFTIRSLAAVAHGLGYRWFGCFALENGNAIRVYQRAGMQVVASATEFSRELGA